MTFAGWRQQLRLGHALQRLAAGGSVTSVALDTGYASVSAFVSVFRRTFGQTPGRHFRSGPGAGPRAGAGTWSRTLPRDHSRNAPLGEENTVTPGRLRVPGPGRFAMLSRDALPVLGMQKLLTRVASPVAMLIEPCWRMA